MDLQKAEEQRKWIVIASFAMCSTILTMDFFLRNVTI